jgi:hypothetical protein
MAKRRPRQLTPEEQQVALRKRRNLLLIILWILLVGIAALYGYSNGYPLVASGQTMKGILTGLAYGGGALLAILMALFLNRKLRGL